jgi:sarcosine oxidase, subunit gamma
MVVAENPLKEKQIGATTTVVIHELAVLHTVDLRVKPGTASYLAVMKALQIQLPDKPGCFLPLHKQEEKECFALCLSPDWWLLVGLPNVEQQLNELQMNPVFHFSAVDVSGQRTTIELAGPMAKNVLAHLWEQDIREKIFPIGAVSSGLMAKSPTIVYHIAKNCYRIMVRNSFALHLWKALTDAALEYL